LLVKTCRKSSGHWAIPQVAIERLAVPGVGIRHRTILPGDEEALSPEEAVGSGSVKIRRASGSARIAARDLLAAAGFDNCVIPKGDFGAPIWPSAIVGSLAHAADIAIAAVASSREFAGIGIDVEPAEIPPSEILKTIATPAERSVAMTYAYGGRLLFVVKEAVYKAVAGLDRIFLDHQDVLVDFAARRAVVRNGRIVELRFCISSHLVALAFVRRTASAA
jgi:4'-phosphopantetheinyl transferase EntD